MKRTVTFSVLVILAVLGGCKRNCESFDMLSEFDQLHNAPDVQEVDLDCIDNTSLPRTQVIHSDSIYKEMLNPFIVQALFCEFDSLPEIDFETNMLIWSITTSPTVNKVITRQGSTVKHIVKVEETIFASARFRMNAVAIPRLSESDTVIFEAYTYGCD